MKKLFALTLLLLIPHLSYALGGLIGESTDELLDPDVAFKLETIAESRDAIVAQWNIAEGYYLYRDKIAFSTGDNGVTLGQAEYPKGKIKHDEFFGEVEIYRGRISVRLPLTHAGAAPETLSLQVKYQGCADIGVCYPPITKNLSIDLASAPPAPAIEPAQPLAALSAFAKDMGGNTEDELLDPDVAFSLQLFALDAQTLLAKWNVAEGYYLYRDKFKLALKEDSSARLGTPVFPQGKIKNDEFFGRMEIYRHEVAVQIPLQNAEGPLTLIAGYQGCADMGVCYPPITKEIPFDIKALPKAVAAEMPLEAQPKELTSQQDTVANWLKAGNIVSLLLLFVAGLGLAFTPCVFPMIPILSGIIVGQGEKTSKGKAFGLSLAYVLAMAATYTVVGVFAGLTGANIQIWFQNPWVLGVFAAVFVVLSFSMFGFYELQMPRAVQNRLAEISNRQEGGNLIGAGIMGFLSALIVGPCVTAPLIGVLIYISQTGDPYFGGLALFVLSMGMGAPLLAFGTLAGGLMPRAGAWMDAVKAVFGALLIGVAIWLVERVLPHAVTMALWGVFAIVSGIYMGALESVKEGVSGWYRFWKAIGLVLILYGAMLLVGAASGGGDLTQPLKGLGVSSNSAPGTSVNSAHGVTFEQIKGTEGLQGVLSRAQAENKPVMLDFYADWCVSCKEMEKYTFTDPAVQASLGDFIVVQTDVTANDDKDKALMKSFGIFGPPAILFFTTTGEELKQARVVGYMPADTFAGHLENVKRQ